MKCVVNFFLVTILSNTFCSDIYLAMHEVSAGTPVKVKFTLE